MKYLRTGSALNIVRISFHFVSFIHHVCVETSTLGVYRLCEIVADKKNRLEFSIKFVLCLQYYGDWK